MNDLSSHPACIEPTLNPTGTDWSPSSFVAAITGKGPHDQPHVIPSSYSLSLMAAGTTIALAIETAFADGKPSSPVLTGRDALGDWTTDAPGVRRKITIDDLAKPYETPSANNFPKPAKRPDGAMPRAPKGFHVPNLRPASIILARLSLPLTATFWLPRACLGRIKSFA